ncbi:DNA polymerase delta subunit 3-like isoform X2 [Gigantopelta aegis]|uniref:DNA polymerase delta subunit 3-like isoform X2 n=1 Tax=Gigantopelta aegis TaxID=1735272 RepID=UPI001B88D719|nr:DNA polymerase delta subunit 3-like isoform X2 [Gigantopelta aegis]
MSGDELYLDNLDEFVNDENRVVTYKWLSRVLTVHVNEAKRMLFAFCEQQRNKDHDDISVTYFVAGSTAAGMHSPQEYKCAVVSEEQLESYKASLAVVNCVHIYSIHKSKLKDSNALYIADCDGFKEHALQSTQHSAIRCPWAKLRTKEKLEKLGVKRVDVVQADHGEVKTKTANGSSSIKVGSTAQKKTKAEPKGSIASMFGGAKKAGKDNTAKPVEVQNEKSDTVTKNKKSREPKGSIASMFAGAPKKSAVKPPPTVETLSIADDRVEEEPKKEKPKPSKIGKGKKKGSPVSDDEIKPDSKRRRRIKDDLFESSSEEEMDILEESPVPSPVREPSCEPESPIPDPVEDRLQEDKTELKSSTGERKRRRTRKLIPKTYVDEEGFMVTEKVWESDSTDVSEVEEITPKETKKKEIPRKEAEPTKKQTKGKKSPQKKSPVLGKTQASLTSFFRKN